jgi:hypothetical protein
VGDAMAAQSVHCTTAGEPEQTGGQRGPRFTSTGPVQEPPPLASFVSQLGPPGECATLSRPSAENLLDGRENQLARGSPFSPASASHSPVILSQLLPMTYSRRGAFQNSGDVPLEMRLLACF